MDYVMIGVSVFGIAVIIGMAITERRDLKRRRVEQFRARLSE